MTSSDDGGVNGTRNRALGAIAVGVGLAELVAPGALLRMLGLPDGGLARTLVRGAGLAKVATGATMLTTPDQKQSLGRMAIRLAPSSDVDVTKAITVGRPAEELYRFWRDLSNLPRFSAHLESVEVLDDRRSRWRAKAPAGTTVEWEAEIHEDLPGKLLSWHSTQDAAIPNRGSVEFAPAPGGRGTEVRVHVKYESPGGRAGALLAKLFGREPAVQIDGDLRRFKQIVETGEVVHSDASIHRFPHAAQPRRGAR